MKNRQWRLARYPEGMPRESDWTLHASEMPAPGPGELLVKAIYLDVAPYMRGRISRRQNYASGIGPGDVMIGGAIGEVVDSRSANFRPGDIVVTDFAFGWQEYAVLSPAVVRGVDPSLAPLPYWLDAFGLNGITAYFALFAAGELKAGDLVAVSAAAGSVGQICGQLVKLAGCRGLAFTSSQDKVESCRLHGYEGVINYRGAADLGDAVREACPEGVDVFIDNTAGIIHDAVMANLAPHARVVVVGTASLADRFDQPDVGLRHLRQILVKRATVRGFLFSDYQARHEEARAKLINWYRMGRLQSRFDVVDGIEHVPGAFLRLLTSQNIGKQLVRAGAADDPHAC